MIAAAAGRTFLDDPAQFSLDKRAPFR